MSAIEPIEELLLHWEAARQEGRNLAPEDLCAGCPHLADELRRRVQAVRAMERVFGVNEPDSRLTRPVTVPNGTVGANPTASPDVEVLPHVPGYEMVRLVDQGGMGVVYEARQKELGRTVAVKMISGVRLGAALEARFRAEAEASARLQHPNFVQVFEVGQVNGRPFFSMEYVNGGSLAQQLAQQRPSARPAAELVETLALAMQSAHERGIVHRDLKPSNVMLTAEGTPKIADFGLAKRLDEASSNTQTGDVLGTPSYMAPEQAEGKKDQIGPATDVYALGAILYELLCGQPPFKAETTLDTVLQVVRQEPVAPSRLAPAVPPDLEAVCLKCLEKAPGRATVPRALAEDLRRFLNGQPVTARCIGRVGRAWKWVRRHPQLAALVAALVVLASLPVLSIVGHYRTQRHIRLRAEKQAPLVREILYRHCFECHGWDESDLKKNLNVLNREHLLDQRRRIVVPGQPEDSRLIQRIADGSMPPEEEETRLPRLSEDELTVLKDWVLGGAPPLPPEDPANPLPAEEPGSPLAAKVRDIFELQCYQCHNYKAAKGGIKILNYRLLVTVRKVVVPGRPDESELFQLLTTPNRKARMPPPDDPDTLPLSREDIATIRQWIQEGAAPFPKKN